MDIVVLVGRILFGLLFLGSAVAHLTQTEGMAQYAGAKGVPSARASVQVSGVLILVGGLMVILGVWADLGALFLVVFLFLTAFLMHPFWKATGDQEKQTEQVQFLKDLGLAGAALMLFAFFATSPDLGLTITGPLFETSFG
jgi:uncharacterized membrane protein YphA (DoxX/SURF4 family)